MSRVRIVVSVAFAALALAGCGNESSAGVASDTTTVTVPASATTVTVTAPPATTAAATTSEYPKWVAKSEVDPHYTQFIEDDRLVMLAPGVYAEAPADGKLGTREDYSAYLGECTAINRYSEQYPGGHTCW